MMNCGSFTPTWKMRIVRLFLKNDVVRYLRLMRKCQYYSNLRSSIVGGVKFAYYVIKYKKLGKKLGLSIGYNVFGYGLVMPHYGTIVVGSSNRCGNYCVLHTSTCISDNGKAIGDALYLATGAKMTSKVTLGDNVSVGANSVVNKSYEKGNALIAGAPARYIKDAEPWYIRDGESYPERVKAIEKLKREMGL